MEGLAGVGDLDTAYRTVGVSPRLDGGGLR